LAMMQRLEELKPNPPSADGRSWRALCDRRRHLLEQAIELQRATDAAALRVCNHFIAWFNDEGARLLVDEEQLILSAIGRHVESVPSVAIQALNDHFELRALIRALSWGLFAGCVDLRVVHRLARLLAQHLLFEEEQLSCLLDCFEPDIASEQVGLLNK
jgi:hypothetical protein